LFLALLASGQIVFGHRGKLMHDECHSVTASLVSRPGRTPAAPKPSAGREQLPSIVCHDVSEQLASFPQRRNAARSRTADHDLAARVKRSQLPSK
jgi:hypothetical protein